MLCLSLSSIRLHAAPITPSDNALWNQGQKAQHCPVLGESLSPPGKRFLQMFCPASLCQERCKGLTFVSSYCKRWVCGLTVEAFPQESAEAFFPFWVTIRNETVPTFCPFFLPRYSWQEACCSDDHTLLTWARAEKCYSALSPLFFEESGMRNSP